MKELLWGKGVKREYRKFPEDVQDDAGYQLHRVQAGQEPLDWKPIKASVSGIKEIRVWEDKTTYRIIYIATFPEVVYVLHAFQKKGDTKPSDIEMAIRRYKEIASERAR